MLKHEWAPFVISAAITAYLYFTFEIVIPYAEEQQQREAACKEENGTLLDINGKKYCVDNNIIIKTYDN